MIRVAESTRRDVNLKPASNALRWLAMASKEGGEA